MSLMKLVKKQDVYEYNPVSDVVVKVSEISTTRQFSDGRLAELAVATESLDVSSRQVLEDVYNNIDAVISEIASNFNISLESYQKEAANIASILATNPKLVFNRKLSQPKVSGVTIMPDVTDGVLERPISLEAYDERDNRSAQAFSVVYNLLASRQDDFGETFFPTIVVNPTDAGIVVSTKLYYAYNDFKRSVTGALADHGRKNVIRAYTDPDILKNEQTRVVPVLRIGGTDDNTDKFAPVTDVPAWVEYLGSNISVQTGALRPNVKVDLIGISQTNELLNSGLMGPTDTLDVYIKLEKVFIKVTDGTKTAVVPVSVEHLYGSMFTFAPQGNYRNMILTLNSDGIVFDKTTKDVNGNVLGDTNNANSPLPELVNHNALINISINGSIILDKGTCEVSKGSLSLVAVRDSDGNLVTGATETQLRNKIDSAEVVGYTLIAYRANSNLRQRGQLFETQVQYFIVNVPYRSPLAILMPSNSEVANENSAVQDLITYTGIRVSNDAVTTLLKASSVLKGYNPVANKNGDLPELNYFGSFYVRPVYLEESIDLSNVVDSLKSHERAKDIRAALVEKIRYYANEMYRLSEYKAAANALTGNNGMKPTVIVGTDVVLYNYIMLDGDLRTLGETFDVKVVSTLDKRVRGKVFITFGVFDGSRNTTVNPLNFGNMLWSPELTVVMPISRDGQISKELIVTPRYLHMVNLPILTVLDVTGLPEVTGKVHVEFKNV